jgi:hypothetical protein
MTVTRIQEVEDLGDALRGGPEAERRYQILRVEEDMLLAALRGELVVDKGLPPDTRALRVTYAWDSLGWLVLLTSKEFSPIPLGQQVPSAYVSLSYRPRDQVQPNGMNFREFF